MRKRKGTFYNRQTGRKAGGRPRAGLLDRLSARLRDIVQGTGGDGGQPSSLTAVPVPVRSDEYTARRRPR